MKRIWLVWFDADTMANPACEDMGMVNAPLVRLFVGMRCVATGRIGRFVVAQGVEQAKGIAAKTMFVGWPVNGEVVRVV